MKVKFLILMSTILVLALFLTTGCMRRSELVVTANGKIVSTGGMETFSQDESLEFVIQDYVPGTSNECTWTFRPVGDVEVGDPIRQESMGSPILDQRDLLGLNLISGDYSVTAGYSYQTIQFWLRVE